MPTLSIANQKGGVGKTTSAINLAAALQQMGHNILLVDMDPQANLTQALGLSPEIEVNIYTLIRKMAGGDRVDFKNSIQTCRKLHVLPASLDLANAELELVSVYGREKLLSQLLKPLKTQYDYIIIDCPPAIGMLTVNALTASDYVLIPLQAEFLPLKGVHSFMRTFEMVRKQLNRKLQVLGFVLTKYDQRKQMNRQVLDSLVQHYGEKVFATRIRSNIALAQAQEKGMDIFQYDPAAHGAFDYRKLAQEILQKIP